VKALHAPAWIRRGPGLCLAAAVCWCQLVLGPGTAQAQSTQAQRESTVKAAFLYKFASFVDWPAGTFARADEPLVIGVADDGLVASDLEQLVAGRSVDGHPVVARRVRDVGSMGGVNILFLGYQREGRLREALAAAAGPVLVVTTQEGALRLGSVINFSAEGGRVRFSVSLAAAEQRSLKLSARLLTVAQAVEGRNR
jgi:hypothetical protein